MLTISKPLSAGQARTYHQEEFSNAQENYYSEGDRIHGEWHGKLAEKWGLHGGFANSGSYDVLSSAEIYDPASKSFSMAGGLTIGREEHTATVLQNGKLLIVGGSTPIGGGYTSETASAEIYDPSTGLFTATGSLAAARFGHTATLLPNGKVLVAGGYQNETQNSVRTVELYDPTTGTFTTTGSLSVPRAGAPATLLNDGTVLMVGGVSQFTLWASSDIFNSTSRLFAPGPNLSTPQYNHSATLLNNGTVLLAGGTKAWAGASWTSATICNPTTPSFTPTASLALARQSQTATVLNDGTVLLVGGDSNYGTAELYNPSTQIFQGAGATEIGRQGHSATLLNDGTVLIVGGTMGDGTAELYEPGLPAPLSVQISPASANMADGGTQQFVALDELGQQRTDATWTVSDTSVATLQSTFARLLTAVAPGQITLTADVDGVIAQAQVTVAPVSLQITPGAATIAIGTSRQFTVVDERGRPSKIATWTVSDPSLAAITTDSSPTLTALASGQVTLTANVEGVSTQMQVTMADVSVLLPGTVQWSNPSVPGFSTVQLVQAVPTGGTGPDLYSVQSSSDGSQTVVQALTSDGQQLWQSTLPGLSANAVPDGFGGLIEIGACNANTTPPTSLTISDVNPVSNQVLWQIPFPTVYNGIPMCVSGTPKVAIRQDGAVVVAMPVQISPALFILDGLTGAGLTAPSIPPSTMTGTQGEAMTCDCLTPVGQPIVDSDGSVYVEYDVIQSQLMNNGMGYGYDIPLASLSTTLSLLKIAPDGTTTTTQLGTSNNAALVPGNIIPDGQGGVLATWVIQNEPTLANNWNVSVAPQPYQAADVSAGAVLNSYPLPNAPQWLTTLPLDTDGSPLKPPLVLGENGTAFVSYGTSLTSFNLSAGSGNWNYVPPTQTSVSLSLASDGNTLLGKITDQTGTDTVLQLDSGGSASFDSLNGYKLQLQVGNQWFGYSPQSGSFKTTSSMPASGSSSNFSRPGPLQLPPYSTTPKLPLRVWIVDAIGTGGFTIDPNLVTQEVTAAIREWQLISSGRILLDWGGLAAIQHVPSCMPTDQNCPADDIGEITLSVLPQITTRFPATKGSDLIFTLDLVVPPAYGLFPVDVPGYTLTSSVTGRFMNKSLFNANPGSTIVAHELGHQFQLTHVADGGNLMCGVPLNSSCDPTKATQLTSDQIENAIRGMSPLW